MEPSTKLRGKELRQAYRKLITYSALDNRLRLRSFFLIRDNPGIPLKEIAREVRREKATVAVQLGILSAAGLVTFTTHEENGKPSSTYNLTELGTKAAKEISAGIQRPQMQRANNTISRYGARASRQAREPSPGQTA